MKKSIRRTWELISWVYRWSTSRKRVLPDFVIIGAQKCGTSFLYRLLNAHPYVIPPLIKEIHYFDLHFEKGLNWYRAHFSLAAYKYVVERYKKETMITGEASPYYLYHPHAPRRIAAVIPQVKLIVLLRNPVDRAYSHYYHEIRKKREPLSFEEAIAAEKERLHGERERMLQDEYYCSFHHLRFSYLQRGIYVDQLQTFAKYFARSQFLMIKSEELYANPIQMFDEVLEFLKLPKQSPTDLRPVHVGHYPEMKAETRKRLQEYFEPHNQRLYKYLGRDFAW